VYSFYSWQWAAILFHQAYKPTTATYIPLLRRHILPPNVERPARHRDNECVADDVELVYLCGISWEVLRCYGAGSQSRRVRSQELEVGAVFKNGVFHELDWEENVKIISL